MSISDRKTVLGDLGKATKRGIRRCPQCGTINGTRGLSCKNSLCDVVFKEIAEKPKRVNLDACKLITEHGGHDSTSRTTTFSIRLRERCPDYLRSFVQIVYGDLNSDDVSANSSTTNPILLQLESLDLSPISGTCFVSGCHKKGQVVKVSHDEACLHVMACINGDTSESKPFTVKHSVLNAMSLSSEWKHTIWLKVFTCSLQPYTILNRL